MKTVKLIVTDLDGTLLRTDKSVSRRTIQTLENCRSEGIKLAFATGRTASALSLAPMELFDGHAVANGAVATIGDTVVHRRLIPWEDARPFLVACHERGLHISSQLGGEDYSNFVMSDVWPEVTYFTIVDFKTHALDADKIITYNLTHEDIDFIQKKLPPHSYMVMAVDGLAMITHVQAKKSYAINALCRHWGISPTETVAFGDDLNDIDMLECAGTGVAMGNALNEVKQAADDICKTNDEDGLAIWIEENILHRR